MRYGVSMYGGVMAYDDLSRIDDTSLRKYGYSIFRVWATWERDAAGNIISGYRCINADGTLNSTNVTRLKNLIARVKNWGGAVDVTMGAKAGRNGMNSFSAQKTGVTNLVTALRGVGGIYCIDLANEYPSAGYTDAQAAELLVAARAADGSRGGFTVSCDGPASSIVTHYKAVIAALGKNWKNYLGMFAPHFNPQDQNLAKNTEANVRTLKSGMSATPLSVYVQEEGYWNHPYTKVEDYYTESAGCRTGGAVAYTFHTLAGFDLRTKHFLDQLNPTEKTAVNLLTSK